MADATKVDGSAQTIVVDDTVPTLATAGVKYPIAVLEFNSTEAIKGYLTADNKKYDFADVKTIAFKTAPKSCTITKDSNREFTITSTAVTAAEGEDAIIVVSADASTNVEIHVKLIVFNNTDTRVQLNKQVIDIAPGNEVPLTFTGLDANSVAIESVIDPDSKLKFDITRKVVTTTEVGDFVQGIIVTKNNVKKKLYVQASSADIITTDETDVSIHAGENYQLDITLNGDNLELTSNKASVCTVDKNTKTITPKGIGSAVITVTGSRGDLRQVREIPVTVRETVQPVLPELVENLGAINGGEVSTLTIKVGKGDKVTARIEANDDNSKGTLRVELNKIYYYAPQPENDTEYTILVKNISSDNVESAEIPIKVKVLGVPATNLVVPAELTIQEGDTYTFDNLETDAKTISFLSSVPDILAVNTTRRSITALKYGSATLTIAAQAIGKKLTEKQVEVTIQPQVLNRPALKTKVLQVTEGDTIELEFAVDLVAKLQLEETTKAGTLEINGNKANWTAPELTSGDRATYTFRAWASREETGSLSKDYIFKVVVLKRKTVNPDDPTINRPSMSYAEILDVVKDDQLEFEEKIAIVAKNGPEFAREVVEKLNEYEEYMGVNNKEVIDETTGGAKNYELFLTIRRIVESKNNDEFQALFSLINLYFKQYRNSAFKEVSLHRFDRQWPGGDKNLVSYQLITTCIYILADILTRASNLKRVDFNTVFDKEKTIYQDYTAQSIIKYYTN